MAESEKVASFSIFKRRIEVSIVETDVKTSTLEFHWRSSAVIRLRALFLREFDIAEASFIIGASFLISAMLGAVRQFLLAAEYGTGDTISAYYAASKLPETLFTLIAGGALWTAMIPILTHVRLRDGDDSERRLADTVLTAVAATAIVIVVIGQFTAPLFVSRILVPGFDNANTELTIRLTRLLLIHPLIIALASVAMAVLNARSRFLLPAVALAIHNLAEIAGIAAAWVFPSLGIYGPVFGVIAGALLQAILLFWVLWPDQWKPRFNWSPRDRGLRDVLTLLVPTSLSLGVGYLGGVLDTALASRAPEEGAIPAIVNAWLLVALPVRMIGFAAGQGAFPRLVMAANEATSQTFRKLSVRVTGIALLCSIPVTALLILLSRISIRLFYEHGEFSAADGDLTSRVVILYAIGIPAYVVTEVLTRSLVALRDTRTPLATNILQFAMRAAIAIPLLDQWGVAVIPIAFAASSAVEAAVLFFVLRHRMSGWRHRAKQGDPNPRFG